jgi:hypothetical protein
MREFLDQDGAAAFIGLAGSTLATLRVRGGGPPFYKIGNRVRYDRADLDAWLSARRRVSTRESSAPIPTSDAA